MVHWSEAVQHLLSRYETEKDICETIDDFINVYQSDNETEIA